MLQPIPRGVIFPKLFQSSKLKTRTSLFTETWQKRSLCFELWALKQNSKMSPQVGLAITWLTLMCDMTHSCMQHEPFICVRWLIHMCNMTHSHVWHDIFRSVTRLTLFATRTATHPATLSYTQMARNTGQRQQHGDHPKHTLQHSMQRALQHTLQHSHTHQSRTTWVNGNDQGINQTLYRNTHYNTHCNTRGNTHCNVFIRTNDRRHVSTETTQAPPIAQEIYDPCNSLSLPMIYIDMIYIDIHICIYVYYINVYTRKCKYMYMI